MEKKWGDYKAEIDISKNGRYLLKKLNRKKNIKKERKYFSLKMR
jgi:hypothetical protein